MEAKCLILIEKQKKSATKLRIQVLKQFSILENPLTFRFNVVKLTPVDGPPEAAKNKKDKNNRQWNQQIQNIHQDSPIDLSKFISAVVVLDSRKALNTTSKELKAIPKPASQAGSQPITASGTHTAL